MAVGALAVAVVGVAASRPPSTLRATLLAVPGQAALIQTPAGVKVLLDGGQSGAELLRQLGQLLPPWDRGLDLVVVTSARADHTGGLGDVFGRYAVQALVEPDLQHPSVTFRQLGAGVRRIDVEIVDLGGGAWLRRTPDGWRLEQGNTSLLVREQGFDVKAGAGSWRVIPAGRAGSFEDGGEALNLSETGNVTVTFGAAAPLE